MMQNSHEDDEKSEESKLKFANKTEKENQDGLSNPQNLDNNLTISDEAIRNLNLLLQSDSIPPNFIGSTMNPLLQGTLLTQEDSFLNPSLQSISHTFDSRVVGSLRSPNTPSASNVQSNINELSRTGPQSDLNILLATEQAYFYHMFRSTSSQPNRQELNSHVASNSNDRQLLDLLLVYQQLQANNEAQQQQLRIHNQLQANNEAQQQQLRIHNQLQANNEAQQQQLRIHNQLLQINERSTVFPFNVPNPNMPAASPLWNSLLPSIAVDSRAQTFKRKLPSTDELNLMLATRERTQGGNVTSTALPTFTQSTQFISQPTPRQMSLLELTAGCELVSSEIQGHAPDCMFVAFSQMKPCKVTEEDKVGKNRGLKLGMPGLCCKNCGGSPGCGRFFPSTFNSFVNGTNPDRVLAHVGHICIHTPSHIREVVQALEREEDVKPTSLRYGSRKAFFWYIWTKFQNAHAESLEITEVGEDKGKASEKGHKKYTALESMAYAKSSTAAGDEFASSSEESNLAQRKRKKLKKN